jgi:aryl-alcohol dehydrogenase-like predicted oxidoreductase
MEHRRVGNSGLQVSVAGLGCNNFGGRLDAAATESVVHAALDLGVTLFDTADMYGGRGGSEELLGRALASNRDEVVIATKFARRMGDGPFQRGASRRYIVHAVEASLRRLGTDRIDLYQQHCPDADTPIDETLAALDDLVRAGKVLYIGSSNFAGWQIAEADAVARAGGGTRFVSAQNEWSLLRRAVEREVVPASAHHGVSVLPFFPLASGMLTGKYRRGEEPPEGTRLAAWGGGAGWTTDANFDKVDALAAVAEARGHGVGELALAWLAAQPVVCSVIAGATSPEQLKANVTALEWRLDADDLAAVEQALADSRSSSS